MLHDYRQEEREEEEEAASPRLTVRCRCTSAWPPSGCSERSPPPEGATSPHLSAAGPRHPERRCTASKEEEEEEERLSVMEKREGGKPTCYCVRC